MNRDTPWDRGLNNFADKDHATNIECLSSDMTFGQDSWDDSAILDIFDDAIRSHKTKKGEVDAAINFNRSENLVLLYCISY